MSLISFIRYHFFHRPLSALRGEGPRSPQWPATKKAYLKAHPLCAATGRPATLLSPLDVHHVVPFAERPELELDWSNLITLRRDAHLLLAHFGDWNLVNPNIRQDAADLLKKIDAARQR